MKGDMVEVMAGVVMHCDAILACVTKSYLKAGTNANMEFKFACDVREPGKSVFGIKMNKLSDMNVVRNFLRTER